MINGDNVSGKASKDVGDANIHWLKERPGIKDFDGIRAVVKYYDSFAEMMVEKNETQVKEMRKVTG